MKSITALCLGLWVLCVGTADAATLVESSTKGRLSRMYVEGSQGRIEPGESQYIIVDLTQNKLYSVIPERQMVMDMSDMLTSPAAAGTGPAVDVNLKEVGSGPTIAGYDTTHYDIHAAETYCGSAFLSKAALQDSGMAPFLEIFLKMADRARALAQQFGTGDDPCMAMDSRNDMASLGMPLRTLDKHGAVLSEVTRIVNNSELPPNAFEIPANYTVQNTAQMMDQAQQQMQQVPQMDQTMKQLQENGQLPPEALEKIKQLQEMMRQKQQ